MNKADAIMAKVARVLSTSTREHLSKKEFAEPGHKTKSNPAGHGAYPIPDKSHARNALARVSQFGSPSEKAEVRAKVHAKYPDIGEEKSAAKHGKECPCPACKKMYGGEKTAFLKAAKHFVEQHHPEKVKEIYEALEKEHPEYSAGKKARIANSTYDKMK